MPARLHHVRRVFLRLRRETDGSVLLPFGLALVVIAGLVGGSLDYARAVRVRGNLQGGLDSAVLAGAKDSTGSWSAAALRSFEGNVAPGMRTGNVPTFSKDGQGVVTGAITAAVPTTLMRVVGFSNLDVSARSVAIAKQELDNSCILTLDHNGSLGHESLLFNGGPSLDFGKCTIRSNTSIACNGHDGGSVQSLASGAANGCSNPTSAAPVVPDIYAPLASNISRLCGANTPGATWSPGVIPKGVITAAKGSYTEFHICGDLTLSGVGYLTGIAPASDSVVVIENGSLNIASNAAVSTVRVAFVLAGNNSFGSSVSFNGASLLALSPPTSTDNPWHGVSLYQDPSLTKNVDNNWGPGTSFNPDGVVYLPNSNITIRGAASSNIDNCTKVVANSLQTNGSVAIKFGQSAGCAKLGMDQWSTTSVFLSQ